MRLIAKWEITHWSWKNCFGQKMAKTSICCKSAIMDFWDLIFWEFAPLNGSKEISKNGGKQNFKLSKLSKTAWFLEKMALKLVTARRPPKKGMDKGRFNL